MNTLSLLLYLADIVGTAKEASIVIGSIGFAIFLFITAVVTMEDELDSPKYKSFLSYCKWVIPLLLVISVIAPSSKTMYLIIASEMGEELVETEEMSELRDAVLKRLREYNEDE